MYRVVYWFTDLYRGVQRCIGMYRAAIGVYRVV